MHELIKITEQNGQRAVSARELHRFLESKQEFVNWIKNRIYDYGFVRGQDYEVFDNFIKNSEGGRPLKEYIISLDMAKELSMVERNEKGKLARLYFIEMEKKARETTLKIPSPKTYNGVKCIHYVSWLLQNGYSVMSGQVRSRIKKYPGQFHKGKDGWYMSEAIAGYYLNFRDTAKKIAELPNINPELAPMFSPEELKGMIKELNQ